MRLKILRWPYPYKFAFGITDDPDQSTTDRVRNIYDFCESLGIYPTRGTWIFPPRRRCGQVRQGLPDFGVSLEDEEYREWCLGYQARGGEIGLHSVSSGDNTRDEVAGGLERFEKVFGCKPKTVFFHKHNAENMYWGESFSNNRFQRFLVRTLVPTKREIYLGHDPKSEYFCGDLMRDCVRYTRLFRTRNINVLAKNPNMPFHLIETPLVRFWFSASAQDIEVCEKISESSLSRVSRNDGLVLIYAHMAEKFVSDSGDIHPIAKRALECVGNREDCWKVGVSQILDRCYVTKNLVVTHRRAGVVLSNPTQISFENVQIQSDSKVLYLSSGVELEQKTLGVFVLPVLGSGSSVSVFDSPEAAEINDPFGMPRRELARMKFEELKRLLFFRKLYRDCEQVLIEESELDGKHEWE